MERQDPSPAETGMEAERKNHLPEETGEAAPVH